MIQTDSVGLVSTRWTMGRTAGPQTLTVRVDTAVPPLRVTARALPGAAANLSFLEPPVEGPVGRALPEKIVAVVTDVYGNPVPDAVVSFATRSGGVTPTRAAADTAGRVSATWTLGAQPGEQALSAFVRASDVEAKLVLQAITRATTPVQAGTPRGTTPKSTETTKPGATAAKAGTSKAPASKPAVTKPAAAKPAVSKPAPPKKRPSRSE
jgi:hypothetical protein